VDLNQNFTSLDDDALASYAVEVRAAFDALAELDTPTAEQITEAEALAEHYDALIAEQGQREVAAQELADRAAALKDRFKKEEVEEEPEVEVEAEVVEVEVEAEVPAAAASRVVTLSKRVARPPKPEVSRAKPVVITAAADVPEFSTGSPIESMGLVGKAVVNRMRGFGTPTGNGESEDLHKYGVASFRLDFEDDLTIDRHSDDMEVLMHAASESRLPGKSLTAAGGWCAPSETLYDLCAGETTEGILSIPEVNVARRRRRRSLVPPRPVTRSLARRSPRSGSTHVVCASRFRSSPTPRTRNSSSGSCPDR
jgi:hypothetical protein